VLSYTNADTIVCCLQQWMLDALGSSSSRFPIFIIKFLTAPYDLLALCHTTHTITTGMDYVALLLQVPPF